jgi:hypothetical protein
LRLLQQICSYYQASRGCRCFGPLGIWTVNRPMERPLGPASGYDNAWIEQVLAWGFGPFSIFCTTARRHHTRILIDFAATGWLAGWDSKCWQDAAQRNNIDFNAVHRVSTLDLLHTIGFSPTFGATGRARIDKIGASCKAVHGTCSPESFSRCLG